MKKTIGIRRESKYPTEKRAPLTPDQVRNLIENSNLNVLVESSTQRVFTDEEYEKAGATITGDLSECNIIFGVKEVPIEDLIPEKAFCFFSHTIKGQSYNMPMLKEILNRKITLLDYELVKNKEGKRIIFFGNYAGYAGMINSLWLLGRKYLSEGIDTPFAKIKQAKEYKNLVEAKKEIVKVGLEIKEKGLPGEIVPLITGFTGYGNVSKGAQAVYDLLPVETIKADDLKEFVKSGTHSKNKVYKVEFSKFDIYKNKNGKTDWDSKYVSAHPKEFESVFYKFIPHLSMLINGIFWDPEFDKLVTKEFMKEFYMENSNPKLKVIGDITCDVEGSIELTAKITTSDNPAFVYEPLTGKIIDGWEGNGPVILAVDKLPAELPGESSEFFGKALLPFVEKLATADYTKPHGSLGLPEEFCNAVIAHQGELTEQFKYLLKYLS